MCGLRQKWGSHLSALESAEAMPKPEEGESTKSGEADPVEVETPEGGRQQGGLQGEKGQLHHQAQVGATRRAAGRGGGGRTTSSGGRGRKQVTFGGLAATSGGGGGGGGRGGGGAKGGFHHGKRGGRGAHSGDEGQVRHVLVLMNTYMNMEMHMLN